MAEKEVSEEKDTKTALLDKLGELEVFRSENEGTIQRICSDLSKAPVPKQLAVGGAAGWAAGYLTMKVGKMAATAVGGSLLLLQIAHHKGYIKVVHNIFQKFMLTLHFVGGLEQDDQRLCLNGR